MIPIHKRTEYLFATLAARVYAHKFITMGIMLLITAIFASQLKHLTIDTREESYFHKESPTLIAYNDFRDEFGQDDMFIIGLHPHNGLTPDFLKTLMQIHTDLEESVPYLEEITSLVNGRVVRVQGDTLIVEDLMPQPPNSKEEHQRILETIGHYPFYENLLVSPDRSMAMILIRAQSVLETESNDLLSGFSPQTTADSPSQRTYLSNEENLKINTAIRNILQKYEDRKIRFYLAGAPVFVSELQKGIQNDLRRMIPLSFGVIILFLAILFRNVSGVIYPLITVFLSLISAMGIMAFWGIPITNAIQILPTFLIVVGIGDSVHILTIFFRYYKETGNKQQAIIEAVGFAGLPILMTSITTACGLLSFIWADLAVIAQLGYIAPVGVMLALVYTLILLPALIAIFPIGIPKATAGGNGAAIEKIFDVITRLTTQRPVMIVAISTIIVILAGAGAAKVHLSHNAMTWLPDDSTARVSTEILDKKNGGTVSLEVLIDSGKKNGLHDPDLLARIDAASKFIPTITVNHIQAGKVVSMAELVKETHRALHQDHDEAYTIPHTRDMLAQELLLFESSGNEDLSNFVDSTYQIARLSILAPFTDSILYKDYTDKIEDYLQYQFPKEDTTLTGHMALFIGVTKLFITSMAKSYIFAIVIITLLMMVMVGKVKLGLMSMIANIIPVIMVFGIMGAANIPLDMATILIGSLILGLVVDDTIHFLHHFRKAFEESSDVAAAVRETLFTTGRALTITSLVLCGGFFIYTTSFLANNVRFGILSASAVLFALMADFLLVPSLLTLVYAKSESAMTENRQTQPT